LLNHKYNDKVITHKCIYFIVSMKVINFFDMYSVNPKININGKQRIPSALGICLTIFTFFLTYHIADVIMEENKMFPIILMEESKMDESSLQMNNSLLFVYPSWISDVSDLMIYSDSQQCNKGKIIDKCSQEELYSFDLNSSFLTQDLNFYCIDLWNYTLPIKTRQMFSKIANTGFSIRLALKEGIFTIPSSPFNFLFFSQRVLYKPLSTLPLHKYIVKNSFIMSLLDVLLVNLEYSKINNNDNVYIQFSNHTSSEFSLSSVYQIDRDNTKCNLIFQAQIYINEVVRNYFRHFYSPLKIFSDFMGAFVFFNTIMKFLYRIYGRFIFDRELLKGQFNFDIIPYREKNASDYKFNNSSSNNIELRPSNTIFTKIKSDIFFNQQDQNFNSIILFLF
jgi:hypothetical protein